MTSESLRFGCALVALVTIWLGAAAANTKNIKTPGGSSSRISPILAMELLRDPADMPKILGTGEDLQHNRIVMTDLIQVDFAFIPTYTLLFLLVGALLFQRDARVYGILLGVLALSAAAFDVLENTAILNVLSNGSRVPHPWSVAKWALIFAGFAIVAYVYLDLTLPLFLRILGFIAAGISLLTAAVGLAGVAMASDRLIQMGSKLMGLSLVAGFLFFASCSWVDWRR
jgi:hypothetical protein